MLVLTRKVNQSILIGDPNGSAEPIEIVVVEGRGDQVRLGIAAPRGVVVDRKEIWLEKQSEEKQQEEKAVTGKSAAS